MLNTSGLTERHVSSKYQNIQRVKKNCQNYYTQAVFISENFSTKHLVSRGGGRGEVTTLQTH